MRTLIATALASLLCAPSVQLGAAPPAGGEVLTGQVQLVSKGKKKPLRSTEVAAAVVYYQPSRPLPFKPPVGPVPMLTRDKSFTPRVLTVVRGATVAFPNGDPILHNVFSVSPGNRFDLGLYRKGKGKERTFDEPGLVRVFCNVHYEMIGYILVLETPAFTSPDSQGAFRLEGLPRGPGKLSVWHERTGAQTVDVALPLATPLHLELEVERKRIPPHSNKWGKPYTRGSGERYR